MSDLDDLLAQARRVSELPAGPRRDALWLRYSRLAAPLVDERATLLRNLSAGYTWLNSTSRDDDPKYAAKEALWCEQWLPRYTEIEDALREAASFVNTYPTPMSDSQLSFSPTTRRIP